MAHHICTNCTWPTPTLYKVYSTPGSIQLTTCKKCGRDVDPYIEREWLLVVMDCALHRPEAFRHVLYNREPFCDFRVCDDKTAQHNGNGKDSLDAGRSMSDDDKSMGGFIPYSIMASLLRTYLWYVSKGAARDNDDLAMEILIRLAQSIVGEAVLVLSTIFFCSLFIQQSKFSGSDHATDSKLNNTKEASSFYSRLYLALTIPVFFHIATIFALIWENSSTVSMLGTLFVLSLQYTGVSVVTEERMGREERSSLTEGANASKRLIWRFLPRTLPFIIGLALRTMLVHLAKRWLIPAVLSNENALASCTGITLFGAGSLCIS
mmetsp:Transcript_44756/g.93904  ORF Transcript_44756/g.93904 Transcript_44756/m.93904 type:complete len:321 (+) Transcript_44756:110-1072(+)|eukprot:CAMPEP_0183711982 /NCGR_PEP_ID=MMETSP0737-20130205/7286_1 /TAXON_ID=385413 /ORGANISM="Thalassiosira miniscula, Strain CCMP1093" /LENGTH=320 /DNA_ID=CAMNT_0025940555 /DNA_START=171 /DNA_END=1133 /DNA_ORIENTATION=-